MLKIAALLLLFFLDMFAAEKFTETKYVFRYMEEIVNSKKINDTSKCIVNDNNTSICLVREEKAIYKPDNVELDLKTFKVHTKEAANYETQKYSCGSKKENSSCVAVVIAPSYTIDENMFKEHNTLAIKITNKDVFTGYDEYVFVINKGNQLKIKEQK